MRARGTNEFDIQFFKLFSQGARFSGENWTGLDVPVQTEDFVLCHHNRGKESMPFVEGWRIRVAMMNNRADKGEFRLVQGLRGEIVLSEKVVTRTEVREDDNARER